MAHPNTILSQALQLIPRHRFQTCVIRHNGGRCVRNLTCWGQFASLLAGQLAHRDSQRGINRDPRAARPPDPHTCAWAVLPKDDPRMNARLRCSKGRLDQCSPRLQRGKTL